MRRPIMRIPPRILRLGLAVGAALLVLAVRLVAQDRSVPNECGTASDIPMHRLLRVARSIRVASHDSAPIASITSVAIGTHGLIAWLDARDYNVKLFDATGSLLRIVGRRGQGPGELAVPSAVGLLGDTSIVVADMGRARLIVYDLEGALRFEQPLLARPVGRIVTHGQGLLVSGLNGFQHDRRAPRLALAYDAPMPSEPVALGILPASYARLPFALTSSVLAAPSGAPGAYYITWSHSREVLLVNAGGQVLRTLELPTHSTFADPREVARSAPPDAVMALTSPIVHLFASAGRLYVSYMQLARPGMEGRHLRYHVLEESGIVVASDVRGRMIVAARGDTIVTVGSVDDGASGYDLTWMVRCR